MPEVFFSSVVFSSIATQELIKLALAEDSVSEDYAAQTLGSKKSKAVLIAREELIVCGLPILKTIIAVAHSSVKMEIKTADGKLVKANHILAALSGPTAEILTLERTMLNFIQRMSGIASITRRWVDNAGDITILDTRKTLPGYRHLDKYATRIGGAKNHRMNLSAMAMIKNNHIDATPGGMKQVTNRVRAVAPLGTPLEIEVRDLKELKSALLENPTVIMLDNMNDTQIRSAISIVRKSKFLGVIEVSGGIKIDRLATLNQLGVTHVSVGSLTHSVRAADISLRIVQN